MNLSIYFPLASHLHSHSAANLTKIAKGNLTASELGTSSLDHIVIDDTIVEYICLHWILSDFLSSQEVQNLKVRRFFSIFPHHDPLYETGNRL